MVGSGSIPHSIHSNVSYWHSLGYASTNASALSSVIEYAPAEGQLQFRAPTVAGDYIAILTFVLDAHGQ